MAILRFPRVGSTRTVDVYEQPDRDPDESDQDFAARVDDYDLRRDIRATVELVDREQARAWAYSWMTAIAADQKRTRESGDADALGVTPQGIRELAACQREVLDGCLLSVHGVALTSDDGGDLDLASIDVNAAGNQRQERRRELIAMLEECDLMGPVAQAARRAQKPDPQMGKS